MSQNYVLLTDSCSDLTKEQVEKMGLVVAPLSVEIEGKSYKHYPDERELNVKDFYDQLRDKKVAKTSLINVGEFIQIFEPILKSGKDILYIAFSSALSGSYQSAMLAKSDLELDYPDRKIEIIDSKSASMGEGLLVWYAQQLKDEGKSLDEVKSWIEAHKLNLCHLFTVDDLGTLKRGGRLSSTSAFVGTLLKVKPVLHVSNEGKLVPIKKARGRKTSLQVIVDFMKESIVEPEKQTIFISHGDDLDDAKYIGDLIADQIGVKAIIYGMIGPVIGAHSGPKTIAVFFMGDER